MTSPSPPAFGYQSTVLQFIGIYLEPDEIKLFHGFFVGGYVHCSVVLVTMCGFIEVHDLLVSLTGIEFLKLTLQRRWKLCREINWLWSGRGHTGFMGRTMMVLG